MGVGDSWGTREELLHPRDSKGRFRSKWKMSKAAVDKIMGILSSFAPKTWPSDEEAARYVWPLAKKPAKDLPLDSYAQIQKDLRAGKDSPGAKQLRAAEAPLPDDLIVSSVVGPEAFGLTPETIGQIEEYTGKLVADKGFRAGNVGTPIPHGAGQITIVTAVPKGTRAVVPGDGSREVILTDEQPLRITKVDPDGQGGFYVLATAMPIGSPGNVRTKKLGTRAPTPTDPDGDGVPGVASPAPGAPVDPNAPAPRVEEIQSPSVGGDGGTPNAEQVAPGVPPTDQPATSPEGGKAGVSPSPDASPPEPAADAPMDLPPEMDEAIRLMAAEILANRMAQRAGDTAPEVPVKKAVKKAAPRGGGTRVDRSTDDALTQVKRQVVEDRAKKATPAKSEAEIDREVAQAERRKKNESREALRPGAGAERLEAQKKAAARNAVTQENIAAEVDAEIKSVTDSAGADLPDDPFLRTMIGLTDAQVKSGSLSRKKGAQRLREMADERGGKDGDSLRKVADALEAKAAPAKKAAPKKAAPGREPQAAPIPDAVRQNLDTATLPELRRIATDEDVAIPKGTRKRAEVLGLIQAKRGGGTSAPAKAMEADIADAYERIAGRPDEWLGLADLREVLGGTRAEQDAALLGILDQDAGVRIIPTANTKGLRPRDRAAALRVGDEDSHAIMLSQKAIDRLRGGKSKPGTPSPAPKQAVKKTAPEAPKLSARDTGDIDRATVAELRQIAKDEGLRVPPKLSRKQEIKDFIATQRKEDAARGIQTPAPASKPVAPEVAQQRVRDAFEKLSGPGRDWVSLTRLRRELGGMSREDQDRALKELAKQQGVSIVPEENQKALTQADRDSAIHFGGDDKHLIQIHREEGPVAPARSRGATGQISEDGPSNLDPELEIPADLGGGTGEFSELRRKAEAAGIQIPFSENSPKQVRAYIDKELERRKIRAEGDLAPGDVVVQPSPTAIPTVIEVPPEIAEAARKTTVAQIRQQAKDLKISIPAKLTGKAEIMDHITQQLAKRVMDEQAGIDPPAPKKAAPKRAPGATPLDPFMDGVDEAKNQRVWDRIRADLADPKMTPREVGRQLETWANGPMGPSYQAAVAGGISLKRAREQGDAARIKEVEAEIADLRSRAADMLKVAERLKAYRRPSTPAVARVRRSEGKDLIDWVATSPEFKPVAGRRPLSSVATPGDPMLTRIAREQGWMEPAGVGTSAELDKAIGEDGWTEVWRGALDYPGQGNAKAKTARDQFAEMRTSPDFVLGRGVYGNGIYTSTGRRPADMYASPEAHDTEWQTGDEGGAVIRMAIDPKAKIGNYDDLIKEWQRFSNIAQRKYGRDAEFVAADFGRWAAMKGYDVIFIDKRHGDGAITVDGDFDEEREFDQYMILNRTAVLMEDQP